LLAARPLVRLGCYGPARARMYCLPLWAMSQGDSLWFYHPPGGAALLEALREHPQGVCAQVDNLDCSPAADPGQPWRSALAEGTATVHALGPDSDLPAGVPAAVLHIMRDRLASFAIRSVFVPPDPDLAPPAGALIRLRIESLSGQATGEPL
ncbi:MAG: pyridoxamine 5'-phosphate oxidase family protein, partial [Chloroflexota bacterium]|nr:pyridoxamine 5'-phosphate oxidase family protein [Chloroflexota bacterium]